MKPSQSSKRSRHATKRKKPKKVQAGISTSHINTFGNSVSEMSPLAP
jgi:hypothetical protein